MKYSTRKSLLRLAGIVLFAMTALSASAQFDYVLDVKRTGADADTWNSFVLQAKTAIEQYSVPNVSIFSDENQARATLFGIDQATCDSVDAALQQVASLGTLGGLLTFSGECVTGGQASTQVLQTIINSVDLSTGWFWIDWLDYFYGESFPWVFPSSYQTGWIYLLGDPNSLFCYGNDLNAWLWTNASTWPYYYNFATSEWKMALEN